MSNVLTNLELIDIDSLFLHEPTEQMRLIKIARLIQKEDVIRNPLMAIPMVDNKYLILDGAHRTAALKKIGCRRVPVQLVNPQQAQLYAWTHIVPLGDWLHDLYKDPNLIWSSKEPENDSLIATIINSKGTARYVSVKAMHNQEDKLDQWCQLVKSYSQDYPVKRLPKGECLCPEEGFVLFQYPTYTLDDLKFRVLSGKMFPSGVTRFLINGRLLNLSIPLDLLTSEFSNRTEWSQLLEKWQGKVRLYSESIYLCEA